MFLIPATIASTNTPVSNSSQPIILLGEMNAQSPAAESYEPKVQPTLKLLQEQNAISAAYDQKQDEIAAEEEYFYGMDFGMYDGSFGDEGGMYNGYPEYYGGPGITIPLGQNRSENSANQPPKELSSYESQLPNGDIVFKQWCTKKYAN